MVARAALLIVCLLAVGASRFIRCVLSGPFYRDIGVTFLLAAISASAWNLVGGYAGQVSVGHSMFFGLGAYLPLLFYNLWGLPPLAGIPAGIALSVVLALVIGLPTFRLTGHYFSMATIAVAELDPHLPPAPGILSARRSGCRARRWRAAGGT